jgi:hypothetical protein
MAELRGTSIVREAVARNARELRQRSQRQALNRATLRGRPGDPVVRRLAAEVPSRDPSERNRQRESG